MKSIYGYANYRAFLKDFYYEKKRNNPYYSYRLFSMKAGFRAPNLLKLVMDGDRNLTRNSLAKFVRALKLGEHEAQYFETLVARNQEGLRPGREDRALVEESTAASVGSPVLAME
jgi:uncharacterized protein (TIGR02147 family)